MKSLEENYSNIIYKSGLPWLKLDLELDVSSIWDEIKTFKEYGKQSETGWEGLAYRGIDLNKMRPFTNYGYSSEDDVPYAWTELADMAPLLRNSLEKHFPDVEFYRVKINKLKNNGVIPPHSDSRVTGLGLTEHSPYEERDPYSIKYVTIALDWPKEVEFYLGGKRLPIRTGDIFLLDFHQIHEVYNFCGKERVSAIFTGRLDSSVEFKELVIGSYNKYKSDIDHQNLKRIPFKRLFTSRINSFSSRIKNKLKIK